MLQDAQNLISLTIKENYTHNVANGDFGQRTTARAMTMTTQSPQKCKGRISVIRCYNVKLNWKIFPKDFGKGKVFPFDIKFSIAKGNLLE